MMEGKEHACVSYHFIFRPALLYELGYRFLDEALQGLPCIITALVKLRTDITNI